MLKDVKNRKDPGAQAELPPAAQTLHRARGPGGGGSPCAYRPPGSQGPERSLTQSLSDPASPEAGGGRGGSSRLKVCVLNTSRDSEGDQTARKKSTV